MRLTRLVWLTTPRLTLWAVFALTVMAPAAAFASMSIQEAARLAVTTNPNVAQAAANRRAVDSELRQTYGAYLPKLDLSADAGRQKIDRPRGLPPANNDKWRSARS